LIILQFDVSASVVAFAVIYDIVSSPEFPLKVFLSINLHSMAIYPCEEEEEIRYSQTNPIV